MDEKPKANRRTLGQSFVELAIFLPILLLLLATLVEVGLMFFAYMTAIDLTREAARFASPRDFGALNNPGGTPQSACADNELHFYYDTACFFIDPNINPTIPVSPTNYADVAISVLVIDDHHVVDRWPHNTYGVWSLYNDNWRRDCQGNIVFNEPYLTNAEIDAMLLSSAPDTSGVVLVEFHFCYDQLMDLPGISQILDNPFRMRTYSMMPSPEAIPTPTPIP
jgi:hypothetical protein